MLPLEPDTILNKRFKLITQVGEGGFGVVWKAADMRLERNVAIKRIAGLEAPADAINEARKLASLKHSNIVQVYDVFPEDGGAFIVTEFVEGESLADLLRKKTAEHAWITCDEAILLFEQTAEALAHAHQNSIVHRDIKPENILVSSLGEAKLTDFGIARRQHPESGFGESNNRTVDGARSGTIEYMSPEQLSGKPLDFRTDVFSLGIVAYLLLTQRHPFNHASGLYSIARLIGEADFVPERASSVTDVPEHVSTLVAQMLDKNVEQRVQSASDVLAALRSPHGATRTCPNCGSPNAQEALFCAQCGKSLDDEQRDQGEPQSNAADLTNEGYAAARADDWQAAIQKYRQAIAADASFPRAYGNLGFALNRVGKYEDAITVLDKAIDLQEHPSCYDYRAFALGKLRRNQEAINSLDRALDLSPGNINIMLHRSRMLMIIGQFEAALQQVNAILTRDTDNTLAVRYRDLIREQLEN